MFFKQVRLNASKSRKNNGLFFGSLVISIVAFYTLLSLGDQDVMRYLKMMESDAVSKLMLMIPIIYIVSLFFVFFLVYFAYRYQLENRKKEFGLYLMMGMKRSKLFAMLMSETLWNSMVSILIGLPVALLLTEGISLATAKMVGLGIIGHEISFSTSAIFGTVIGFIIVQMIAMLFLCIEFSRKEPMQLLLMDSSDKQVTVSQKGGLACFIIGLILLIFAYVLGITMLKNLDFKITVLILVIGGIGTFLIFRGLGSFIGRKIQRKGPSQSGLFIFTGRQIQENVLHQYKAMAVSSLLLLMALACVSFGIGVGSGRASTTRTVDFSIDGSEQKVREVLESKTNKQMISAYYPMFLDYVHIDSYNQDDADTANTSPAAVSWSGLISVLENFPKTDQGDNMIENFSKHRSDPYLITESSYNNLLKSMGNEPLKLKKNQAALYTSMQDSGDFISILDKAVSFGTHIEVDGEKYEILPNVYTDNIVADRKITIYCALIVSDENYNNWVAESSEPFCWNVRLNESIVEERGLMQSLQLFEENIAKTGLEYESYISGVGRNLFYTVAASYLTIYLGILFMIIANTVIGLKYLLQQRKNKGRYLTLLMLGANSKELCRSAKKQIWLYFFLVLGVAVINSVFAILSMFTSFVKLPNGASIGGVILLSVIAFVLFIVVEFIYIAVVKQASTREIMALRVTDRR